ncbi:alkaline phosphatase family protein [Granulicella sp. L60]|uniref:alkaline phosphatase family protein n=1 Tax=Granulicella sp. L60 TaxID=1641866 RepID=UPI0020B129A2|nr:alkaline phosphatase family protein [Granulicella sp. L60]
MKSELQLDPSVPMAKFTRRRLLKSATGLAIAAAAETLMPPNVQRMLAQGQPRHGTMRDIKHVVMLMQENRSFDHYFGTLAGVRGFDDPHALTLPHGKSVFHQPDTQNPNGYLLPFHLNTRVSSAQKIPSTSHGWAVQHEAWDGGRMDNWVPAHRKADGEHGPYTMSYYKREDIPFHFALADAFTICDDYHCSMMGPTGPNRMYWLTGTVDPDGQHGGPMTHNNWPEEGFAWTTYAERLEEAGISWKAYSHQEGHIYNRLLSFRNFIHAPKSSPLYTKGMTVSSEGQFEYDAIHDKLPAVSWLFPTAIQSEHPDYTPAEGAAFIASKLDAIASNPDVWAKTAFILNYDENDGIFDHVPPPVPPPGTAQEFIDGLPIGAGFRVPCILISPWTAGGWVCSQPFDHTSVLQFLEKFTGVRETNISDWRRQTFGDLTSAFRFNHAAAQPPMLPDTTGELRLAKYAVNNLPAAELPVTDQQQPKQEKGTRRRIS